MSYELEIKSNRSRLNQIAAILVRERLKLDSARLLYILPAYRDDPEVSVIEPVHVESLEAVGKTVQASLRLTSRVDDTVFLLVGKAWM